MFSGGKFIEVSNEWGWRGPCRSATMSQTGNFLKRWWYYGDNIKGQFTSSFNGQPFLMTGRGEGSYIVNKTKCKGGKKKKKHWSTEKDWPPK